MAEQLAKQTDHARAVGALRTQAGGFRRTDLLTIRVQGADRVRFLNGMLSRDVAALEPGQAVRAIKANAKGRVEGMVRVRCRAEDILLDVREVSAGRVAGELVKFIVMDDVDLSDVSDGRQVVVLSGPEAARVLAEAGFGPPPAEDLTFAEGPKGLVLRDDELALPSFELHVEDAEATLSALVAAGGQAVDEASWNVVRVEAGRPLDGVDLDADTIPLEARLDAELDLEKGCYIGQEVIARATHRGGVKHHLVGLDFEGATPPGRGAELWATEDDKRTGEVTSAVYSPTLGRVIGLGYVHIKHEAAGQRLEVRWGEHTQEAVVVALPHVGP